MVSDQVKVVKAFRSNNRTETTTTTTTSTRHLTNASTDINYHFDRVSDYVHNNDDNDCDDVDDYCWENFKMVAAIKEVLCLIEGNQGKYLSFSQTNRFELIERDENKSKKHNNNRSDNNNSNNNQNNDANNLEDNNKHLRNNSHDEVDHNRIENIDKIESNHWGDVREERNGSTGKSDAY